MSAVPSMGVMTGVSFMAAVAVVGVVLAGVGRGGQWVSDLFGPRRYRLAVGGLVPVSGAMGGVVVDGTASIWLDLAVPVMVLWCQGTVGTAQGRS
ncbi:hypothetical protein ACO0LV_18155 [Pseudactinotalea sp. Z1739]|uniref:hypothetical protein n=1 Tax=Pseudactinotalea sp. Z1739 TaxID=3413028 RepID=UPI003C7987F1